MKTYIIRYAPMDDYGCALQDFMFVKVLSELDKEQVKTEFENRCAKANEGLSNYKGMYIEVYTTKEFLSLMPTEIF